MSGATSLTDAVKAAATGSASLTDAVKEAARSGTDATVVSFPRLALHVRQDAAAPLVRPSSDAHEPGPAPCQAPPPPEDDAAPTAPAAPRPPLRGRTAASRPLASPRPLRFARRALPGSAALRALAGAVRLAAVRLAGVAVVALLSLVAAPSPVGSGSDRPLPVAGTTKRVALVIGNSAYLYARRLDNPRNDAADIGAALTRLGFQVIEGFDLDKAGLDAKIREFTRFLRGADVAVFFYAGHGLHMSGQNYLVPVDARLGGAPAVDLELVRLDLVHRTMEREAPTNVLFFDACRETPLFDSLARALGTGSAEIGRGLAVVQGGAGTLISFSTQPGTIALDGKGRNSPYSAALARQLSTSHEDVGSMLIAVRNEVMQATGGRQVPWEHSALTGRFYFNPAAEPRLSRAPAAEAPSREAYEAWSAAKDTTSLAVLEAFVARYGETFYAELARARMADLRKEAAAPAPLAPVAELAPSFGRIDRQP